MKQKIKKFVKINGVAMLLSFCIPIVVMGVSYYLVGIYPGSQTTILASDSFTQYANFHASFNNVLHGKQNIFYTWFGSLGLNYWAFMAYYLNGVFTPLIAFFDNVHMPDALYFLTLIKFGASGLAFWIFAHNTFKVKQWVTIGLSISYALMSYAVGYSEVIMWLDTFMYLPLVILGINRLMDQRKPTVLFLSYLLLFLSNFYMAFMVGVFSFLYFLVRTLTDGKRYKKRIKDYLLTSLLAGGASMVTILPTIFDLSNNGERLTKINTLVTPDVGVWDLVAKNLVGVYDTSKYQSMPFIYVGLMPLMFCVFYFLTKKVPLKNKILFGSLFILLIASIYIYPLNLFWHGLHSPNMFLFRFSFLFSFVIILLAGYGLEVYTKADFEQLLNGTIGIGGLFILFLLVSNKKRYGIITTSSLIITISLLIIYLGIWFFYHRSSKVIKWLPVVFILLIAGEAFVNSKAMIEGIRNDWGYPAREKYNEAYPDIKALVDDTNETNENMFRLENIDPVSLNDSFNYGYSGVTMFSSIRNRHSSAYVNALGFRSLGSNLQVQYLNNTLLMDALMGIKYNLAKSDPLKFGFDKISTQGAYSLYENRFALPLGVLTDEEIYQTNAVRNQTELFNHLAETEGELFSFGQATVVDSENVIITEEDNNIVSYGEQTPNKPKKVTWLVTVPAKSQGYLSIVSASLGNKLEAGAAIEVTVDNHSHGNRINDYGQYYNIGYFENASTIKVTATFTGSQKLTLFKPDVAFLNTQRFEESVKRIQEKGVNFKTSGRKANATVSLKQGEVVLTTIPYDKGWKAYIDGEKVDIPTFKDAFLAIPVPKGTHTIEFVFLPQGFAIGASLFILCILTFSGYSWIVTRKKDLG
ncbi:YfhO family protein [Enterococcus crotali]